MPIYGYMKVIDPGRISSISTREDGSNKRKILGQLSKKESFSSVLLVRDCSYPHLRGGSVVPVNLRSHKVGKGWTDIGTAKCCPLCWVVIEPPVGSELPPPTELLPEKVPTAKRQRAGRIYPTHLRVASSPSAIRTQDIEAFAKIKYPDTFTMQELVEATGESKTSLRKTLRILIDQSRIFVVTQGSPGRGNATTYQKAP